MAYLRIAILPCAAYCHSVSPKLDNQAALCHESCYSHLHMACSFQVQLLHDLFEMHTVYSALCAPLCIGHCQCKVVKILKGRYA